MPVWTPGSYLVRESARNVQDVEVEAADGRRLAEPPACRPFDPSVAGRYELYQASMEMLLYPDRRVPKMALLAEDVIVDVAG